MENHFEPHFTNDQLRSISSIGLAHMGDAVFEVLVREWLCAHGKATGRGLHQATIRLVCAESLSLIHICTVRRMGRMAEHHRHAGGGSGNHIRISLWRHRFRGNAAREV